MKNLIFLVGYMGSGKTTIGSVLAEKLECKFIDTDDLIEKAHKQSITSLFEKKGESKFRDIEKETLRQLDSSKKQIIATGGGMPCFRGNMKWMKKEGQTIFLKMSIDNLQYNLCHGLNTRPLLAGLDPFAVRQKIKSDLIHRNKHYLQADIVIRNENDVNQTVNRILNRLKG